MKRSIVAAHREFGPVMEYEVEKTSQEGIEDIREHVGYRAMVLLAGRRGRPAGTAEISASLTIVPENNNYIQLTPLNTDSRFEILCRSESSIFTPVYPERILISQPAGGYVFPIQQLYFKKPEYMADDELQRQAAAAMAFDGLGLARAN